MGISGGSLVRAAVNPLKHAQSDESFYNAAGGGGKKGGNSPIPPDFMGAAREQGQQNLALARTNAQLNNPNVKDPLGNRTVTWSGDTPTITNSLNPQIQGIFDRGLGRVNESFSKPFSFGGADDLQAKAEDAYLSRLEPRFQRDDDSLRSRLSVQGIDPYGEAANKEHERLSFAKNDARSQAVLNAFNMRPQMLQEELTIRNQPLNEVLAVMGGAQVQPPQFSGSNAQPAPTFEATQNQGIWDMGQYNVGQQRAASSQAGLFGLGAAALPYVMSAFSDRRLKSNVERIGTHPLGIGVYEYDIFGKRERGLMADEVLTVKPDAVSEDKSGYLMVDYGKLQ